MRVLEPPALLEKIKTPRETVDTPLAQVVEIVSCTT